MLVVKDAMVLIHLAKMTLLEAGCALFEKVVIPPAVYEEVCKGEAVYPEETHQLKSAINKKYLSVKEVKDQKLKQQANEFNIYGGEAEAVALYWQEGADLLATDDDNVRKKKYVLKMNTIGTPAILMRLLHEKKLSKDRYLLAVKKLKMSGWFSSTVFDTLFMEGAK